MAQHYFGKRIPSGMTAAEFVEKHGRVHIIRYGQKLTFELHHNGDHEVFAFVSSADAAAIRRALTEDLHGSTSPVRQSVRFRESLPEDTRRGIRRRIPRSDITVRFQ